MCMLHSEFQAILFFLFVFFFVFFFFFFCLFFFLLFFSFLFCFIYKTLSKSIFKPDISLHSKLYGSYLWRDLSKYDSREVNKSATRNISLFVLFLIRQIVFAASVDPDQTPRSVVPDLGLHCLPRPNFLNGLVLIYDS